MTSVSLAVNLAVEVSLNSKTKSKKPSSFRHQDTKARGGAKRTESNFPVLLSLKTSSFCDEIQAPETKHFH